ncbi:hypothetical protein N9N28_05935 [Rubripirellula amarantea]|uniref:Uncharacterized protein n=1 Tax=Rubripirellula amarantea TaxID=2527999 RepID=A0A5C5WSV0_9BACT|nr:hypothetical protein [Rubripirellula amarantea]MDA8744155.1 hypothetical protein [Rubripirellula amarantea]TWT53225.1 hypothetical protein Pla22_08530 [Rubripirellula amarantea]
MHRIRLRYPWTKELRSERAADQPLGDPRNPDDSPAPLDSHSKVNSQAVVGPQMVHVPEPDSQSLGEFVYTRKFNRPTGLDDATRIFLSIAGWQGKLLVVAVNQSPLKVESSAMGDRLRIPLETSLQAHNELRIVLAPDGSKPARLSGEVQLEIEDGLR